ncbi:MAG: hypothetical protein MJA83_09935, partial [Gammaproteobacteria bacterium]|nr:hypothetical protein [Gammaproteobacteria bacterium]
ADSFVSPPLPQLPTNVELEELGQRVTRFLNEQGFEVPPIRIAEFTPEGVDLAFRRAIPTWRPVGALTGEALDQTVRVSLNQLEQ